MDYKILQYSDMRLLELNVKEHLKEGWKCQGGINVTVSPSSGTYWYAQAMIKEK